MIEPVFIVSQQSIVIYANKSFLSLFHFLDDILPASLVTITRNLEFQNFIELAMVEKILGDLGIFASILLMM